MISLRDLRGALPVDSGRVSVVGAGILLACFASYCVAFAALVTAENVWLKLFLAVVTGSSIGVLFVAGHDASHGSLTRSEVANRWLARLAFLPSAMPNETWDSEHNRQHHSWTNLTTKDPGYVPLSPEQYRQLNPWQRIWRRASFTLPGIGLAYIALWWEGGIRINPTRRDQIRSMPSYALECVLIAAFLGLQVAVVVAYGAWSSRGLGAFAAEALLCIALPFYVWCWVMAFVTILHHTHPRIRWFDSEEEWLKAPRQFTSTVHVSWPKWFSVAFLWIFSHPAHHADKRIPMYRLDVAQHKLQEGFPEHALVERGTFLHVVRVLKLCRLYDYRAHRWLDWDGRPTTESLISTGSAEAT
ncbi:fatty acid desaturase [Variovorax sp. J2P1-59]|uniref:fatty acid desaturase n=1 Tax=Variovorax flavidus TaxID=3053501 RepID=UPI0025775446|nr:fatty acid desaturase [Variovorax sp. J2P1-59]MDM0078796.1 fatty acid desaturase [Variovorax sp. J2P1-59]